VVEDIAGGLVDVWLQGGFVMWFLVPVTLLMWFGIGVRAWRLRRGMPVIDSWTSLDAFLARAREGRLDAPVGLIDAAVARAVRVAGGQRGDDALRSRLEEALMPLRDRAGSWGAVVKGAAITAPLAGLLGTVTGMISTFDALGSGMMYTAGGGGIGAGVSEALVSTQTGLVVAVPGILVGALLLRKQRQIEDEMDRLIEKLLADGGAA